MWVSDADDAVDVILLEENAPGDVLEQTEEGELIEVRDLILLPRLLLLQLAAALHVLLLPLLAPLAHQQEDVVGGGDELHHLYLLAPELHLELVEVLLSLLEDLLYLVARHLYVGGQLVLQVEEVLYLHLVVEVCQGVLEVSWQSRQGLQFA